MRIISGSLRGRKFSPPSGFVARPTTDKAKESLFNILNNLIDFEETEVLDLFAGSGSISFEFASRGSQKILSIENNKLNFFYIKKVITELNINSIQVIKSDVFRFIEKCEKTFDVIFADPPYDLPAIEKIPNLIGEKKMLKPEGMLIIEHSPKVSFETDLQIFDKRNYGKVNFSFFKNQ